MIKEFNENDLKYIVNIWLNCNLEVHGFIEEKYFYNNLSYVKQIFPKSEIYILEEDNTIKGFIGLNNGYIEGLFVKKEYRNKGIGTKLISKAKNQYDILRLDVYEKNKKALDFYLLQGFKTIEKRIDKNTNEMEIRLEYKKEM